ncbi:hypothetical protein BH24ACT15_BH24ACT15_36830 [soil metagenome]
MRRFARWYNHEHYHSGIAYLHPADLRDGIAGATIAARQAVRDAAYRANPKRFRNRPPKAPTPPTEAWINNPTPKSKT